MRLSTRQEITNAMALLKNRDGARFNRIPDKPEHLFREDTIAVINASKDAILTLSHVPGREVRFSLLASRVRLTGQEVANMVSTLLSEATEKFGETLKPTFIVSKDCPYIQEHGVEAGAELIAGVQIAFDPRDFVVTEPTDIDFGHENSAGKVNGHLSAKGVILHPTLPYTIKEQPFRRTAVIGSSGILLQTQSFLSAGIPKVGWKKGILLAGLGAAGYGAYKYFGG